MAKISCQANRLAPEPAAVHEAREIGCKTADGCTRGGFAMRDSASSIDIIFV
jgi:hypothetical protein